MLRRKFIRIKQFWSERFNEDITSTLDSEFLDLRRKVCLHFELIEKICRATSQYLQPNPFMRTKTAWTSTCLEILREEDPISYPHPELKLSEAFIRFSNKLNDQSIYCSSLRNCGQFLQDLLQRKQKLEKEVREKFLTPISLIQKEVVSIKNQLKTFDKRRLEYDYYQKWGEGDITNNELETTKKQFQNSKEHCHELMRQFVAREYNHISLLLSLAQCLQDYHRKCRVAMNTLLSIFSVQKRAALDGQVVDRDGVIDPELLDESVYIDLSKLVLVHRPGANQHYIELNGNEHECENEYYRRTTVQQSSKKPEVNKNVEYDEINGEEDNREEENLLYDVKPLL